MKIKDITLTESKWVKAFKHPITGKTKKFSNIDMAKKWMSSVPAAKPSKKEKLNSIWNSFEQVVANTYPDTDPVEVFLSKYDIDIEDLYQAAKVNGYADPMNYWEEFDAQYKADNP